MLPTQKPVPKLSSYLWIRLILGLILIVVVYTFWVEDTKLSIPDFIQHSFIFHGITSIGNFDDVYSPSKTKDTNSLRKSWSPSLFPARSTRNEGRSDVYCTSGNVEQRVCYFRNICRTSNGRWTVYTGGNTDNKDKGTEDQASNGIPCIGNWCSGQGIYVLGLLLSNSVYNVDIIERAVPNSSAAVWVEEPYDSNINKNNPSYEDDMAPIMVLQRRHYPKNLAHTIFDDIYPIYWTLRQQLIHPAYTGTGAGDDEVGGIADLVRGPTVYVVIDDSHGNQATTNRYMGLFHHVQMSTGSNLLKNIVDNNHYNNEINEKTYETICFHKGYIGFPGLSLHRNAGYAYADRRIWKYPIDQVTRDSDRNAFARFLTIRGILSGFIPEAEDSDSLFRTKNSDYKYPLTNGKFLTNLFHDYNEPKSADTASLVNHQPGKYITIVRRRTAVRTIRNHDDMVLALQEILGYVSLPLEIQDVALEDLNLYETIALLQHTVMFIAIHGAGMSNIIHIPPGAVIVELTLSPQLRTTPIFMSLSLGLGHHYFSSPVLCNSENDGLNDVFNIYLTSFKSIVDIAFQIHVLPYFTDNVVADIKQTVTSPCNNITLLTEHMYGI